MLRTARFLLLLLLLPLTPALHADDASRRAKVKEIFNLIHLEQTLNTMVDMQIAQVQKSLPTLFPGGAMTADQKKDVDAFSQKAFGIIKSSMAWSVMEPQFVDAYATTLSEPTLDGMIAFYRSPAGAEMLAKQPEILAKSQTISQARMVELQPKLQEAFKEFMADMQRKYPSKAPATP